MTPRCRDHHGLALVATLLVSVGLASCYRLTDGLDVQTSVESQVIETIPMDEPAVLERSLELRATLAHTGATKAIVVEVTQVGVCQRMARDRVQTVDRVRQSLPGGHWAVLGVGISLLGGGGTMIGLGAAGMADGQDLAVGFPDDEEAYDTSRMVFGAGIAVSAVGALLIGSEVVDWLGVGEHDANPRVVERERLDGEPFPCDAVGVGGAEVTIEGPGGVAHVLMDGAGRRELRLDQAPLAAIVEERGRLDVSCVGCTPVTVNLGGV